ncbi:hypothetical protein [Lactobacillus taiwanensis]|uniref:hypothetical protein n=1 Tax=Lactobacillus taiwanensis TaxID=508451 RepID=UPI000ED27A28|nr:hypothetical protein [Lactobacillus taiwanensis]MRM99079.1 hypothetical protein [Lactobacillus taiwanensis]
MNKTDNLLDLINVYEYNRPSQIVDMLSNTIIGPKIGIKSLIMDNPLFLKHDVLLFKVDNRYVLPNERDEVKYLGHGNWEIKEWNWSE